MKLGFFLATEANRSFLPLAAHSSRPKLKFLRTMARAAATARMTRSTKRTNDSATAGQGNRKRGRKVGSTLGKRGESTRASRRVSSRSDDTESRPAPAGSDYRLMRTSTCESIGLFNGDLRQSAAAASKLLHSSAVDCWALTYLRYFSVAYDT